MTGCSRAATFIALWVVWIGASASAETMRCQSVNGNLNCASPSGMSCQTVDGRKVCVSGHGDVIQSFGDRAAPPSGDDEGTDGLDDGSPGPTMHRRLERHGHSGHPLLLEQDGFRLHLRTDRLSIDRD